jgi:hypothetical protein
LTTEQERDIGNQSGIEFQDGGSAEENIFHSGYSGEWKATF